MRERRGLSLVVVLIGIALGIGGGLFYAWVVNPVVSTNVAPWQLDKAGREAWIIAASVAWARDGDLIQAANRLNDLRLNESTFQRVADLACELARSSYAQSDAGQVAIRSMVKLAETQGKQSCASDLILVNTPTQPPTPTVVRSTATLIPPPTKTPTPEPGLTFTPATQSGPIVTNTAAPGKFIIVRYEPFCNVKESGLIEVLVQEPNGTTGVRGAAVQVEWAGGKDRFFTGLKPERDDGYADFRMTADESYTVSLPGLSETSNTLVAQSCTDRQNGGTAVTSYRVYFRRSPR